MLAKLKPFINQSEVEIEYRFRLSVDEIKVLLTKMKDRWAPLTTLEQSVNVIYKKGKETLVDRTIFTNNKKSSDKYIKSTIFRMPAIPYDTSIVVSKEKSVRSHQAGSPDIFRIKNRISINYEKYRFDITQSKTITNVEFKQNNQIVQSSRIDLFSKMNNNLEPQVIYDKFLGTCSGASRMEFEI